MKTPVLLLSALVLLPLCPGFAEENPAAPGFDEKGSDAKAIAIADATLKAMGGRAAWDQTRYLTWRFFGKRLHVWDKASGDIRVESGEGAGHRVVLMNLNRRQGRAWLGGQEVTDRQELAQALKEGEEAWINDSYWLFMPYKLKDSGVTLKYKGAAPMQDGRAADVLQLTFDKVGVTPENKYDVYVARDSGLVEQWAYYDKAGDAAPRFVTPWHKWQRYGRILLSTDRGKGRALTDVAAPAQLKDAVLRSPGPPELPK